MFKRRRTSSHHRKRSLSQGEFLLHVAEEEAVDKFRKAKRRRVIPQLLYFFVLVLLLGVLIHQRSDALRSWLSTKSKVILRAAPSPQTPH